MSSYKKIEGFDAYSIDKCGNVFSRKSNKVIKSHLNGCGYLAVSLYKNNKQHTKKIHSLMAVAFLDHKPCGYKLVVDHKDNCRTNNKLSNLQLISSRLNSSKERKDVGTSWSKVRKVWTAKICFKKTAKYLGEYRDKNEAIEAYRYALNLIENGETDINKLRRR